jgi:hypothetical protein
MIDFQSNFRRNEGADYPLEDGGAVFDRRLRWTLLAIVCICFFGILGTAIFVTT